MLLSIVEKISNFAINLISNWGIWGVFVLMGIESACIPIPSEVIMPFAGVLVYRHQLSLVQITLFGTLGCLAGSIITYFIGLYGGRPLLVRYGKYIFINEKKLDYVDNFFKKHGEKTVFFSRILPIVRTFISLPAGISKMNFAKFVLFSTIGSLPWCLALGYVGCKLGENWQVIRPWFKRLDVLMAIAIVALIAYFVIKRKKKKTA